MEYDTLESSPSRKQPKRTFLFAYEVSCHHRSSLRPDKYKKNAEVTLDGKLDKIAIQDFKSKIYRELWAQYWQLDEIVILNIVRLEDDSETLLH